MQPWRISVGLTVVLAGSAVLVCSSRLEYLAPFLRVILADYGLAVAWHFVLAVAAVAAAFYGVTRAAGLANLGQRADLVERSVCPGEGDPELAEALRRDAEGEWE